MITLTIDGQKIQAEEGQTILEVAGKNSIDIPTLCYHPVLEPYGACRMCTVEVIRKGMVEPANGLHASGLGWPGGQDQLAAGARSAPT